DEGVFLLNTVWSKEELEERLPGSMKRYLAKHNINFYIIDASDIDEDIGLGSRTNMIMQSAFFNLTKVIDTDDAMKYLEDSIVKSYGHKGEDIVAMYYKTVDMGASAYEKIDIPESWLNAKDEEKEEVELPDFIKNIVKPMEEQKEDEIPVSA